GARDLYYRMRRVTGPPAGRPGNLITEVFPVATTSEEESRKVAEESREQEWAGRTFLRELFLGNFLLEHIHPFPSAREWRPEFRAFYERLETFLKEKGDPVGINESGGDPEGGVGGGPKLG